LADLCAQYLKKGGTAYVEGRLKTRSWEGDKGKQYRTEIIAETVQFGPRSAGGQGAPARQSDAEATQKAPKDDAIDYPTEDINPDDIPF
jgi:single-strand DNA-binding protein